MAIIFSDGGSRGNPGPAASAFAVFLGERLVFTGAKYLGLSTNNIAEYEGVILALDEFLRSESFGDIKHDKIVFRMDSELVVKQLNGIYRIKDKDLIERAVRVRDIIKSNQLDVRFEHVPRKENSITDRLVNIVLDNQ